jgi:iron(III) transport system substrate-binding protein
MPNTKRTALAAAGIVLASVLVCFAVWPRMFSAGGRVVNVYCAHDAIFADAVFEEFTRQSGIRVDVTYDTEATKSLSLVNRLKLERDHPQCDVFWNNEQVGTMDLAGDGVLASYKGSGYQRIPAIYKDPEGRWAGFAARMRVWIINTTHVQPSRDQVVRFFNEHPDRAAIANPLYGTTLTQFSILWQLWGPDRVKSWRADLRKRGLKELAGNAPVKDAVAAGVCDVGWTDTDDFFEAADDKKPVAMLPVLVSEERLGARAPSSIVIPNTVGLVRGCQHKQEGQQLIDYLLSAENELALARSKARQIPLGPVDEEKVTAEVRDLARSVPQGYDLRTLEAARRECVEWLKSESLR